MRADALEHADRAGEDAAADALLTLGLVKGDLRALIARWARCAPKAGGQP